MFYKSEILALLKEKSIKFDYMEHEAAFTIEDMAHLGITERGTVCKNLFLRDYKGKKHFLVTAPESKHIDLKALAEQIGSTKLSFASAQRLEKYLSVQQGSVSPLCTLNDESNSVVFIADEDLKNDSEVGIHPNDNTVTMWLSFADIAALIKEYGNEVRFAHFE